MSDRRCVLQASRIRCDHFRHRHAVRQHDRADEVFLDQTQQEARYEGDAWEEKVAAYLTNMTASRTTVGEVAQLALGFETKNIGTTDTRRISAIMERLGWERKPTGGVRWLTKWGK
jgi:predicted P-loop ATPase